SGCEAFNVTIEGANSFAFVGKDVASSNLTGDPRFVDASNGDYLIDISGSGSTASAAEGNGYADSKTLFSWSAVRVNPLDFDVEGDARFATGGDGAIDIGIDER
ncbi:MAG: hypothetical protein AAFY60_09985, partial [Myxococcota bacterium]